MNIAITNNSSYIGYKIAIDLEKIGHNAIHIHDNIWTDKNLLSTHMQHNKIECYIHLRPEIVNIPVEGYNNLLLDMAEDDIKLYNNLTKMGIKFVYMSTTKINPYSSIKFPDMHAGSKYFAEQYMPKASIVRTNMPIGAYTERYSKIGEPSVIRGLLNSIIYDKNLIILNGSTNIYTSVFDISKDIISAIDAPASLYTQNKGIIATNLQLLNMFNDILDVNIRPDIRKINDNSIDYSLDKDIVPYSKEEIESIIGSYKRMKVIPDNQYMIYG